MPARHRQILAATASMLGTAGLLGASLLLPAAPAHAQLGGVVFDPRNHAQNLLTAARTLQQVNNQIQSLQNEAAMLMGQAKNLARVDFPELRALAQTLQRIDGLMAQAQGLGFRVADLDRQFAGLFPHAGGQVLTGNAQVTAARARLDVAMEAYRRTMAMQAQVAESVGADAGVLRALADRSQNAEGALQASQAANQLLALAAKQQFQIQSMMAAQYRAEATEAARRAQAEIDGRAATERFLGAGSAYRSR